MISAKSQVNTDRRQNKKLPDDVKHTYIEAVPNINQERKTGLEPATFGLGSQRSTS